MDAKFLHKTNVSFEQVKLFEDNLVCIAERTYGIYNIRLFQVKNLFLEIFYIRKENKADQMIIYDTNEILDLYLKAVDISDLFDQSFRAIDN